MPKHRCHVLCEGAVDRLWLFLSAGQEIINLRCDAAEVIADMYEWGW